VVTQNNGDNMLSVC